METKAEDKAEGKRSKVRILYKSGNYMDFEVENFTVTKTLNDLTGLSWGYSNPRIMYVSLSDIEGIFELME